MERPGKFQRLAAHPEIDVACVASVRDGTVRVDATRGDEVWDIFPNVFTMLMLSGESDVRVFVGGRTVVAMRDGDQAIAVVFRTGAPVAKSVLRMLRRALGHKRPPDPPPRVMGASERTW